MPVVGAYSSEANGTGMVFGLSGAFGMGPTSGAPWPKLAHEWASA
jgi:hypothetical protein